MGVFSVDFLASLALLSAAVSAGMAALLLVQRRRARPAAIAPSLPVPARLPDGTGTMLAAAKSRALTTISHELRTPLGGIMGLADLLAATPLTPEQKSYVAAVRSSGDALLTLIDDVLDLSRMRAGRLDLAPEPFDPVALVEGAVELLAPRAHHKGLEIASFVGSNVPARLVGDPHRLRQVLLNLAGNAVKFTEAGGVGVALQRDPDGRLVFSVADSGPGITADRRAAIFEEFERATVGPQSRPEGAGLGLAIVERIVADMGGDLGLVPRPGGGTLFAVRLPLEAAAGAPDGGSVPAKASTEQRCLIVSPGAFQSAYLDAALRGFGHEVVRITSPIEAVALLQRPASIFDAVFVDCAAGDDEARTVAAVARLRGVGKVVLLFSPHERRSLREPLSAGFDGWLVKPIRRASIAERFEAAPPAGSADRARTAKVLLAEDNPVNALIARAALERLGAEVVHVTDGESACRAVEAARAPGARPFDLALMDVAMPLLDGVDATRRIRQAERAQARTPLPIVVATAHAFLDTRLACESAGVDEVLTKPVDPAHLKRLLAAVAVAPEARLSRTA